MNTVRDTAYIQSETQHEYSQRHSMNSLETQHE